MAADNVGLAAQLELLIVLNVVCGVLLGLLIAGRMFGTERKLIMTLQDAVVRLEAVKNQLATIATNLAGDVVNLKAEIEALRGLVPDAGVLAGLESALSGLEGTVATLQAVDESTPPIPPPGEPV